MKTIKKNLNYITVGELKELIKDFDDSTEIAVWDNLGLVDKIEIEINEYENLENTIDINIEGEYPKYQFYFQKRVDK